MTCPVSTQYCFRIVRLVLTLGLINAATAADDADKLDELMSLPIDQLFDLKVSTVSLYEESIEDAPATISVITREDIAERGYSNFNDLMRDLPGIDLVDVQGTFPLIWAPRGAYGDENKRTLVLIDGIVENNILEGNVLSGPQYSMHDVERVEILWGPASALYGANALSAVINIITKKGEQVDGIVYQKEWGSFNTRNDKLLAGAKHGNFEYTLSGVFAESDGPEFDVLHPDYKGSYIKNAYSVRAKLGYKNHQLHLSRNKRPMGAGQFTNSPTAFFGLPLYGFQQQEGSAEDNLNSPIVINGVYPGAWTPYVNNYYYQYEWAASELTTVKGTIGYRETGIDEESFDLPLLDGEFNIIYFEHDSHATNADFQIDHIFDENQILISGIQLKRSNVQRGYTERIPPPAGSTEWSLSDERVFNIYEDYGVFSQYRLKTSILQSTIFTLGARYDRNSVYGNSFNPRVGIVNSPDKDSRIKLLYGSAYRAPNGFDSFTETTIRVANPDLKPERSKNIELGYGIQLTPGLHIESNIFYNKLTDTIISNVNVGDIDGDGQDDTQNLNRGEGSIYGIEMRSKFRISPDLKGYLNMSFQDPEQTANGVRSDIPNVARFKANTGFTWYYSNQSFYVAGRYIGKRTTSVTNPRDSVDSYFVSDFVYTVTNVLQYPVSITLRVNNLFDTTYYDPGFRSADGVVFSTQHIYPERHFLAGLQISF